MAKVKDAAGGNCRKHCSSPQLIVWYSLAEIHIPFTERMIRHNNGFPRAKLARQ
jgi:hypothetical protein